MAAQTAMALLALSYKGLLFVDAFSGASSPAAVSRTQLHAQSVAAPPTPQDKYDRLIAWLASSDDEMFLSSSVAVRPSTRGGLATGGYGVFATEDVPRGARLARVPRDRCVTLDDALGDGDCGPAFRRLLEQAGAGADTVVLAGYLAKQYLLLQERDRRAEAEAENSAEEGSASRIKFAPYLRTLPWSRGVNAQEHVLFWEDEDVDSLLKGSLAYADAIETRSTVKYATKVLNGVIGPVIQEARGENAKGDEAEGFRFPWQSEAEAKFDENVLLDGLEDAVRGAFVICLSRAFAAPSGADDGQEEDRLEPILDLLQHSNAPNVAHKCAEDGAIELTAATDLKAGDELFNQYRGEEDANMPYHKFFTRFGFVPGITEPVANLIAERSTIFFPQRAAV